MHRPAGFSLLELLIVIVIASLILSNTLHYAMKLLDDYRINALLEQLVEIDSEIRALHVLRKDDFGYGDITGDMVRAKVFPTAMLQEVGGHRKPVHGFGGDIEVDGVGEGYQLAIRKLPIHACIRVLSSGSLRVFRAVKTNGWVWETPYLNPLSAAQRCSLDLNEVVLK